jgi:cytochrome c oxidase subunit 1
MPLMLGAKDLAFPKINLTSWYLFVAGGSLADRAGHGRRGYRLDVLHALRSVYSNGYVVLAISGAFLAGFSSILTGLNFIVTVTRCAHRG